MRFTAWICLCCQVSAMLHFMQVVFIFVCIFSDLTQIRIEIVKYRKLNCRLESSINESSEKLTHLACPDFFFFDDQLGDEAVSVALVSAHKLLFVLSRNVSLFPYLRYYDWFIQNFRTILPLDFNQLYHEYNFQNRLSFIL